MMEKIEKWMKILMHLRKIDKSVGQIWCDRLPTRRHSVCLSCGYRRSAVTQMPCSQEINTSYTYSRLLDCSAPNRLICTRLMPSIVRDMWCLLTVGLYACQRVHMLVHTQFYSWHVMRPPMLWSLLTACTHIICGRGRCLNVTSESNSQSEALSAIKRCVQSVLAAEAKRYLSAPLTSVASERLFSSAAQVYTDTRSRLLPKRADMHLFVKHNLPLID